MQFLTLIYTDPERLAELPELAVGFKRPIYEVLARDFARFATPSSE